MRRKILLTVPALTLLCVALIVVAGSLVGAGTANLTEPRSADVKALSPDTLAPTVTGRDWREVVDSPVAPKPTKIGR